MDQALTTCPNCQGTGLVARPIATLSDNDHIRRYLNDMPFAGQECCPKCGGSGKVKFDPASVKEETKSAGDAISFFCRLVDPKYGSIETPEAFELRRRSENAIS